jgi:uncharacterized protein YukE
MDALDRVLEPGRDLLTRVDAALAEGGAPAESAIWALLTHVGALPGAALRFAAGLDVSALTATAAELRARAAVFADSAATSDAAVATSGWEGPAAEAFGARWRALSGHAHDLAGRLRATASYVDGVGGWAGDLRAAVAGALVTAMTSREAIEVRIGGPRERSRAAAAIGAVVLAPVADALRAGHDLHDAWGPRLGELPFDPGDDTGPAGSAVTTRVDL